MKTVGGNRNALIAISQQILSPDFRKLTGNFLNNDYD